MIEEISLNNLIILAARKNNIKTFKKIYNEETGMYIKENKLKEKSNCKYNA